MRISDWSSDVCSSDLELASVLSHLGDGLTQLRQQGCVELADQHAINPDTGHALCFAGQALERLALEPTHSLSGRLRVGKRLGQQQQIGRASCRERVWQYV